MKNLNTLSFIVGLTFSGIVAAAAVPNGSEIPLESGTVLAGQTLQVALNPLMRNVFYDITCQLDNKNSEEVNMRFSIDGQPDFKIIGYDLNDTPLPKFQQGALKAGGDNVLKVFSVYMDKDGGVLNLINLDSTYQIDVHDCAARPSIGQK